MDARRETPCRSTTLQTDNTMSDLNDDPPANRVREERLLESARRGDASAAGELFELYRPHVRRILIHIAPREEVDDLVQETLCAGSKAIPNFRGQSNLLTWLGGIARNVRRNWARTAARRVTAISLDTMGIDAVVQRESQSDPLEAVMATQSTADSLDSAVIHACSPTQQHVLLLAFEGLALDEIAVLLQMPPATVRSHYRRGRCKLLTYLLQHHADLFGGQISIQAAWEQSCLVAEEAQRPDKEEQAAWTAQIRGVPAYCGAVLKLARFLHLAAALAGIWLGVQR
jgi:RNA polymerase sigma factor (sigma-70 family)